MIAKREVISLKKKSVNGMRVPDRIETGIPDASIKFPTSAYMGNPHGFNLKEHNANFERLSAILERHNMHFKTLGVDKDGGFVAFTGEFNSPLFIWEYFIGEASHNDENSIYVNGLKMQLSTFLQKPMIDQDKLLEPLLLKSWVDQ